MTFLLGGIVLGLVSSGHCIAMCGPISFYCASRQPDFQGDVFRRLLFFTVLGTGKALTYGWIGLCFGWAGHVLTRWSQWVGAASALPWISGGLFVLSGLSLMGVIPRFELTWQRAGNFLKRVFASFSSRQGVSGQFVMGVLWGFLPCPMVLAPALGAAVSGSSGGVEGALKGFFMMFGFGLGTLPALYSGAAAAGLLRRLQSWSPKLVGAVLVGLGIFTVIFAQTIMTAGKGSGHCH